MGVKFHLYLLSIALGITVIAYQPSGKEVNPGVGREWGDSHTT